MKTFAAVNKAAERYYKKDLVPSHIAETIKINEGIFKDSDKEQVVITFSEGILKDRRVIIGNFQVIEKEGSEEIAQDLKFDIIVEGLPLSETNRYLDVHPEIMETAKKVVFEALLNSLFEQIDVTEKELDGKLTDPDT